MPKPPNRSRTDQAKSFEAMRLRLALLTRENEAKQEKLVALNEKVKALALECEQLKLSLAKALAITSPPPLIGGTEVQDTLKPQDHSFWRDNHVDASK